MNFFFDNCLPPRLAKAINELSKNNTIVHLRDRFAPDTPDIKWLTDLAKEQWIIVSGDYRITKNPHEKRAWLESNNPAFFFTKSWTKQDFWMQAYKLVKCWPDIERISSKIKPNQGYEISPRGKINLMK